MGGDDGRGGVLLGREVSGHYFGAGGWLPSKHRARTDGRARLRWRERGTLHGEFRSSVV